MADNSNMIELEENEHQMPQHQVEPTDAVADPQLQHFESLVYAAQKKHQEMNEDFAAKVHQDLQINHEQAISTVDDICQTLLNVVIELRQKILADLDAKVGLKKVCYKF